MMYPPKLPDDCKPKPGIEILGVVDRVVPIPAAEHDEDTAFEAWWRVHGTFIASWEDSPVTIAEAAWSAALEWRQLANGEDQ